MDFDKYLNEAWSAHATNAAAVAAGFAQGYALIAEPSHITQFAHLIVHVYGEHLAQFKNGHNAILQMKAHPLLTDETTRDLARFEATLAVAGNPDQNIDSFSLSDQIRILATALSTNAGLGNADIAVKFLERISRLSTELPAGDPGNRAVAVAGNNVACTLEEKSELTAVEKELMLNAAHCSRKFWAIAGTWLQVQRAEYRLARSYLKACDILNSIKHANLCLTICQENSASPLEMFYAYEAIASIEKKMNQNLRSLAQMEKYFEQLSAEDRNGCEKSLLRIKS